MKLAFVRCYAPHFQLDVQVKLAMSLKHSQRETNKQNSAFASIHSRGFSNYILWESNHILKDTWGQEHKPTELGQNPPGPTRPFPKQTLKELREVVSKDHLPL